MKYHASICLLILGSIVSSTFAALPPSWKKPITLELPGGATDVLVAVPIDAEVYAKSKPNGADLRILDSHGESVSYLRRLESKAKTKRIRQIDMAENVTLEPGDDQLSLSFKLTEQQHIPEQIEFVTPLDNFKKRVRVYGISPDDEQLLSESVIFDYSRFMNVRQTAIDLPVSTFREFRLLIENPTDEQESQLLELTRKLNTDQEPSQEERVILNRRPFKIERLKLISFSEKKIADDPVLVDWMIEVTKNEVDEEEQETHIEFRSDWQPLTRLALETPGQNFSRDVSLEVPEVKNGTVVWEQIAQQTLYQFSFADQMEEQLVLEFPESQHRNYRLRIVNRDSAPLVVDGLSASGPRHQLLFLADAGEQYELYYGDHVEAAPNYDTAALERMLTEKISPKEAELGPEFELSVAPLERLWDTKRLLNNRWLLGSVIGILALLLGVSLYQAGKKVNDLEK